jgi:hypothetical protein
MKNIFCCPGFKNLVDNSGQRGPAAIVVWRAVNQPKFLLQSRGIAQEDEPAAQRTAIPLKINVSSTIGLQYCPFCGRQLQDLLDAAPAEYAELANKHKVLRTTTDV